MNLKIQLIPIEKNFTKDLWWLTYIVLMLDYNRLPLTSPRCFSWSLQTLWNNPLDSYQSIIVQPCLHEHQVEKIPNFQLEVKGHTITLMYKDFLYSKWLSRITRHYQCLRVFKEIRRWVVERREWTSFIRSKIELKLIKLLGERKSYIWRLKIHIYKQNRYMKWGLIVSLLIV